MFVQIKGKRPVVNVIREVVGSEVKNIQVIDYANNSTFSLFQASDDEFAQIFPEKGQDMEFIDDFVLRVGRAGADKVLAEIWERPILKRDANGLHGTLFYPTARGRPAIPSSKREVDTDPGSINSAQRNLFSQKRAAEEQLI